MSKNNTSKPRATTERASGATEEQIYGIKKHTKMKFKELLQEIKLNKAVELIKSTNYSVVEIIDLIGYENPTYFYKIFKYKFKMTSREYKLNLQKN